MLVSKKSTPSLVDLTPSFADPTPSMADPAQASGIWFALGTRDLGLRWACSFHVVCVHFVCVGYPTRTQFPVEYGLKSFFFRLCSTA